MLVEQYRVFIKFINKVTKPGKIPSPNVKPSQDIPKALPLFVVKNFAIAVLDVWLIKPCPNNLRKKNAKIK